MIVDASAALAILLHEEERGRFRRLIAASPRPRMGAINLWETLARLQKDQDHPVDLDNWLDEARIEIVPLDRDHAGIAAEAFRRFGKGNHPAKLNMGDCFAYALAKTANEPLLFKGDDFSQTDIEAAA